MINTTISGRYEIEEIIGTGGMSIVYSAWDLKYDRRVALKVLRPMLDADADFIRRFNQEAQAASRMSHPNIVDMLDIGQDGDTRYLVMEYVSGSTLKDLIREQGRLQPIQAIQMTLRILAAIDHAHKNQIVHRDIKPQNILVTESSVIKVADFGIARKTGQSTMTAQNGGNIFGSVHYFSPEQASGKVADEKSDIYSVGIVLYEMLTGKVPFDGDTPVSIALMHLNEIPARVRTINPDVSLGIDEVIAKALVKDADKRYQSAAEMARDLKKAIKNPSGGFIKDASAAQVKPIVKRAVKQYKKMKLSFRIFMLFIAVSALLFGFMSVIDWYDSRMTGVVVPSIELQDKETAIARLIELELKYDVTERHNNDVRANAVIEQSPEQGTRIQRGGTVSFSVSLGKERIMTPKVSEMTRSEAVHQLEESGLVLGDVTLVISDAKPGMVVKQEPPANDWLLPGSAVSLFVSGESAVMPDISNYSVHDADVLLVQNGFMLGAITEAVSDIKEGTILAQSIPVGDVVLLGSTVDVVISRTMPQVYFANVSISVPVSNDGDEIRCILDEGTDAEREVHVEAAVSGKRVILLTLDSATAGEHILTVYVCDELVVEKTVLFESIVGAD